MDIAIIGASGYTGGDLMRLITLHPHAELTLATSRKREGRPVATDQPHLKGFVDLNYTNPDIDSIDVDLVFLAVPHTVAMQYAGSLHSRGIRTIDLSADYRLPREIYETVYGVTHTAYFEAPYGLPELHREEIRSASFIANPGCFPTGAALAAAPVADIAKTIIFDSKTGVSGAGDTVSETTHYPNVSDNINPYKWTAHRHLSEMEMEVGRLGSRATVHFTPHLVPVTRGILTTAHIIPERPVTTDEIRRLYQHRYRDEPFVRLQAPKLANVRGTNFCDIAFEVEEGGRRIVAVSAIDNLMKGAASQAVQNMNIICGFEETTGLLFPAAAP
ncbi:MAG: N-acetyl-gamma-glutamyl-phosphate reductase [Methanocalculus sp. MSAO_Arc1]|uniref:N-acetyl-gamma-glutamyl-phosphate reductase n=1 Tax=Methanocalculus TaxID=71151 RepID=UPI000FF15CDF|nr:MULTISPECIES: N-acetyl-gamma-glutamyl-phosphate reductase [unclassified Methanocalculus]MCP1661474.1 N-acetyl-gamma-glutamyl-phosphate reductase [Methanocalculus sp. AMF5]RQD79750.1 MAG: N-acetyl-gamma-glutamyl-phosphate reductase [Methanocalculus sp. MSAO_Arc1]